MPRWLPSKPLHWILLGCMLPLLAIALAVSGIFPYSQLNCWTEDVDLVTGRIRNQRYMLTYKISESTQDSWLTESLDPKSIENTLPKWRRAGTFSPFHAVSPQHTYNGTMEQIRTLQGISQRVPFDPDARRTVAQRVLGMWRSSGSAKRAQGYVDALAETAQELTKTPGASITTADLP